MTRRLDPQDRVDELGDASVPFNFDVHAMIFSDDAPALEADCPHESAQTPCQGKEYLHLQALAVRSAQVLCVRCYALSGRFWKLQVFPVLEILQRIPQRFPVALRCESRSCSL